MKKTLLIMTLALLYSIGIYAQTSKVSSFFGDTIWTAKFDGGDSDLTTWTQATNKAGGDGSPVADPNYWRTVSGTSPYNWYMPNANFSKYIDPTSVNSLCAPFATDNMILSSTLSSPEIDATGKSSLCLGFSVFKPYLLDNYAFPEGMGFLILQVSKDNGATWQNIWRSDKKSTGIEYTEYYHDVTFKGWYSIFTFLPADYNNQKIKIRFYMESESMRTAANQRLYIDNIFVSTPSTTPNVVLKSVGQLQPITTINTGAFFDIPLELKVYNGSGNPVTTIQAGFQKNKEAVVVETIDLSSSPIAYNTTGAFTLSQKATTTFSKSDTLTVFVNLTGDTKLNDDTLRFYIQNDMITVPYKPEDLSAKTQPGNEFEQSKWTKLNKSTSTTHWTADAKNYNTGGKTVWVMDYTKQTVDADAYLFSRPVFVEKGKMYDINFDLYTYTTSPTDTETNPVEIYFTRTADPNDTLPGFAKLVKSISNANYKKTTLKYLAQADTSFYVVYHATSKAGAKPLILDNFSITETLAKDAALLFVNSPFLDKLEYTNSEDVNITVRNLGSEAIASGKLKMFYKLDAPGDTIVYATYTNQLPAGYAFDATFKAPAAVKNAAIAHKDTATLKVWIESEGDLNTVNDTISLKLIPRLTKIPYVADLGKKGARTNQEGYWNLPVIGTAAWQVAENDTSAWFQVAITRTTTSGEYNLYSRPFNMKAGNELNLNYEVATSKASFKMPLRVGLYKKVDGNYSFVKSISPDTTVIFSKANEFDKKEYKFSASEDNTYYLGFVSLGKDTLNGSNLMVKNVSISGVTDVALTLQTPKSYRSLVKSTPICITLTNTGTTPVYETIPVSYQIDGQEVVTENVSVEFETKENSTYSNEYIFTYNFANQPDMSAEKDYEFKVYITSPNDKNTSNDTIKMTLLKDEPVEKYGNNVKPVKISTGERSTSGSSGDMVITNDGRLFASFWQFEKSFLRGDVPTSRYAKYAQLLNQEGTPQFRGQGILVTDKNMTTFSVKQAMGIDKQNNLFMMYINMDQSQGDTKYQSILKKISVTGENLFGEDGVEFSSMSTSALPCTVIKVNSDGDVFAQINGTIKKISGKDGTVMKSTSIAPLEYVIDDQDNIHVLQMKSGENTLQYQIYNSDLEAVIPAKHVATQIAGLPISTAKITFDPSGGLWVTYMSVNINNYFYVQYLDSSLEAMIGDAGVAVAPPSSTSIATSVEMAIIDNKLAVFMSKDGISDGKCYLKGQLVSKNGTLAYDSKEGMNIENPKAGNGLYYVKNVYSDGNNLYLSFNYSKYGSAAYRSKAMKKMDKTLDPVGENVVYLDNKSVWHSEARVLNDGYGFYDVWCGVELDAAVGQHVYFDGTLAPKSLLIEAESVDYTKGFVTGGGLLNQGDSAIVKAVAKKGFEFDKWTVNGTSVSSKSTYKFEVAGATKLVANFKEKTSGIETTKMNSSIYAYPNPAVEFIKFANNFEGVVNFYNLSGIKVYSHDVAAGESISVKNLEKGLYIIEMNTGDNVVRQQIIIK